ncbi:SpoIIE family protein phosphatase, partial [bacterium]|nr:SpoIIE family protein phosphatase [bacterium]
LETMIRKIFPEAEKINGLLFNNVKVRQYANTSDIASLADHVSGTHMDDSIIVVVSESTSSIRNSARNEVLVQLGSVGLLGILTTLTVNVVLLRIVRRPLKKLLEFVEEISAGELGTQAPVFHTHEMQELASSINSMSQKLAENDKERRLQMHKARQIQQHLLPNGVRLPHLQTAHIFEPADDVAGDYYDFLPLSHGLWLICLADVTGHGVPAAMGAAMLKALLLTEVTADLFDLSTTMENINRRFAEAILPGNFASMFLGCWDPKKMELIYASAGHEPAVVLRASGKIDELDSTGTLLGIDPDAEWENQTVQLSHADRVLLFSDGVTESRNEDGELFGRIRLTRSLTAHSASGASLVLTNLCRDIAKHRGDSRLHDDLTIVLLQCDDSSNEHCTQ